MNRAHIGFLQVAGAALVCAGVLANASTSLAQALVPLPQDRGSVPPSPPPPMQGATAAPAHAPAGCGDCLGQPACSMSVCCCPDPYPWYLALSGGWTTRETVHEVGEPATFLTWDDGFSVNAALGYRFEMFRVEFEYSLMNQGVDIAGAGIPGVGDLVSPATGNVSLRAYMFNAYHDIELEGWRLKPYVGAGLGFCQSEINSLLPEFFAQLGTPTMGVNTPSNFVFAYQVRAGVSYELSRRAEIFTGYRYFDADVLTFAAEPFGIFYPDGAQTHSLEAGLRVNF